jgi:SPP1 gp7 family putative phage head morphogenesis protein
MLERVKALFAQPKQKQNIRQELARSGKDMWGMLGLPVYNEDDLIGKKSFDIYRDMETRDGQVKAMFMLKKFARLSTPWSIQPDDAEDEEAVRQAEFIDYCFSEMTGSVNAFLLKAYNSMRDGFSIAEKNYRIIEGGEFVGLIGLDSLKVRRAKYYTFDLDEHGNLKEDGVIENGDRHLPANKFIVFPYNPSDDDAASIYGRSDFRAAYRYYFTNDMIQRFWAIFLEKFGQPTVVGYIPDAQFEAKKDDFLNLLKKLQSSTAMVLPKSLEKELLEATRRGTGDYKEAMEFNNMMIARSLLVGTLLMDTGEKGSWALSKTHFDIFIYVLQYLGEETEDTLMREQVIKPLIDLNFSDPHYPYFRFEDLIQEDQKGHAEILTMLVKEGLVNKEEEWVRDYLNLPERKTDTLLPEAKKEESPFPFTVTTSHSEVTDTRKDYQAREPNSYEKKVNFKAIEKGLDSAEEAAQKSLIAILTKARDKLKKDIERKGILAGNKANEIEKLQISYVGELRDVFRDELKGVYQQGRDNVAGELAKKNFQIGLPPAKALQYLSNKSVWIAGIIRDDIRQGAQGILYGGLKAGKAQADINFELDQWFKQYVGGPGIEMKGGKLLTPHHLETVIRTNFTDAYNEGRWQQMIDPDVGDFVTGVEYSAILDDRTTEFCRQLDGKVFEREDPDLLRVKPPNHYNCRSLIVPVTKFEAFEPIDAARKGRILGMKPKGF